MKNVLFIGLSDKVGCTPLQSGTKSGDLIDKIIEKVNSNCYKVNLVNFAPLDENNKLRYPNKQEMDLGYINLEKVIESLQPCICVCLGDKVSKYLSKKSEGFISIKHPSYIAVYKRSTMDKYISESAELIELKLKENCIIKIMDNFDDAKQIFTGIISKNLVDEILKETRNGNYEIRNLNEVYKVSDYKRYGFPYFMEIISQEVEDIKTFKKFFTNGYTGLEFIHFHFQLKEDELYGNKNSIRIFQECILNIINNKRFKYNAMDGKGLYYIIRNIFEELGIQKDLEVSYETYKFDEFKEYISTKFPESYSEKDIISFLSYFQHSKEYIFQYNDYSNLREKIMDDEERARYSTVEEYNRRHCTKDSEDYGIRDYSYDEAVDSYKWRMMGV